jgi:hypothetical protein
VKVRIYVGGQTRQHAGRQANCTYDPVKIVSVVDLLQEHCVGQI